MTAAGAGGHGHDSGNKHQKHEAGGNGGQSGARRHNGGREEGQQRRRQEGSDEGADGEEGHNDDGQCLHEGPTGAADKGDWSSAAIGARCGGDKHKKHKAGGHGNQSGARRHSGSGEEGQ
jgi:hypothetical protein